MTHVTLQYDEARRYCGFEARGHAGFAGLGEDIVCAAISAIFQTAYLGLVQGLELEVDCSMDSGDMRLALPNGLSIQQRREAHIILNTMALGLSSIAQDQREFISIQERRCKSCSK